MFDNLFTLFGPVATGVTLVSLVAFLATLVGTCALVGQARRLP